MDSDLASDSSSISKSLFKSTSYSPFTSMLTVVQDNCGLIVHVKQQRSIDLLLIRPVWGRGTPLPPCPSFPLFYFSLSFIGVTYFLLLSIPSLSTRIVPLRFQAGGRRRRPNLGLVSFFFVWVICVICIPQLSCIVVFFGLLLCVPSVL